MPSRTAAQGDAHGPTPAASDLVATMACAPTPEMSVVATNRRGSSSTLFHPAVEHVAERDHRQLPPHRVRVGEPVHRIGDGKEDGEVEGGKQHSEPRSGDSAECTAALGAACAFRPQVGRVAKATDNAGGPGGSALGFERFDQRREHLVHVAHDAEVGHREDGRFTVLVDGNDVLGAAVMPTRCWVAPEVPQAMYAPSASPSCPSDPPGVSTAPSRRPQWPGWPRLRTPLEQLGRALPIMA